jgi:hypothetical protein
VAEEPDHLQVLADELLALSMPGPAYGADRARWERNARGVIARIFRLGMASGWDKAVAARQDTHHDFVMAGHLRTHPEKFWPTPEQEHDAEAITALHKAAHAEQDAPPPGTVGG